MAYDQCWATSTPGPVAAQDWLEANLAAKLAHADPAHYVVALGAAYGYDWPDGQRAAVVSAPRRRPAGGKTAGQAVAREPPAANPHFAYRSGGRWRGHTVWYLDAGAFKAQRAAAEAVHARGVAICGQPRPRRDPALWTKRGRPNPRPPPPLPRPTRNASP